MLPIKITKSLLILCLVFFGQSALADSGPHVTGRDFARILRLYQDPLVTGQGQTVIPLLKILDVMHDAVSDCSGQADCKESILSLGEGRSSFIELMIHEREHYLKIGSGTDTSHRGLSPFQAVDVSYADHDDQGNITDARPPTTDPLAGFENYDSVSLPLIKAYPKNYHSQNFLNLDIRDENGQQKQFSLIVSNYALGYVLLSYVNEADMRMIFMKVLDHLQPGGMLLMMPLAREGTFDNRNAYFAMLAELKAQGKITDYTPYVPNGPLQHLVVK